MLRAAEQIADALVINWERKSIMLYACDHDRFVANVRFRPTRAFRAAAIRFAALQEREQLRLATAK